MADSKGHTKLQETSKAELNQYVRKLRDSAAIVNRIAETAWKPQLEILAYPPDPEKEALRDMLIRLYDRLPQVLELYACQVERFWKLQRALMKRRSVLHDKTRHLLLYVEGKTGSPCYEDVSNLLNTGFLAAGVTKTKSQSFSPLRRWLN